MGKAVDNAEYHNHEDEYSMKAAGPGFLGVRQTDETGHSTGLATLAKESIKHPTETVKAVSEFRGAYKELKDEEDVIKAEVANYRATKASGNPKVAEALTALHEQSRAVSVQKTYTPAGEEGRGDMRTQQEIDAVLGSAQVGRELAMNEISE